MRPLEPGAPAPEIPGAMFDDDPVALLFYKVTCPTCQLVAPVAERLAGASTGRLMGVAQDPQERVDAFAREYGITFPSVSDTEPYETSNAYGIRTVPTLFVIAKNNIAEVVESWDREGWNRVGAYFGSATGSPSEPLSAEGDGLPPFRPG